ncbi:MAG TPA: hypothetical protein VMR51_00595 [Patescibacteria group bacterium]|nr:hypothetical protein [Patescibacteria group bacterium]
MTELLCLSKNKKRIYYDSVNSHASTHFADTLGLRELVIEVLENRDLDNDNLEFDVDMGRPIGTSDVLETNESDEIVYAIRKNRSEQGYVPFTKSRSAQPSTNLSVALVANTDETYQLSSVWIGTWDDPPFPQQPHATLESKPYWSTHAFVWGSQEIEPNSELKSCPW